MPETIDVRPDPITQEDMCPDCGGPIAVRNPSGYCDHLYYPEYKEVHEGVIRDIKKHDKEIYGV